MNFEPRQFGLASGDPETARQLLYEIRDVECRFPRATVTIGHLDIPAGFAVAVIGKTGCGKSTLLNLLGSLEPPQAAGTGAKLVLRLPDFEPVDLMSLAGYRGILGHGPAAVRRGVRTRIGFVFQSGHLMRDATVSANLAVSSLAAGQPINSDAIEELCKRLGLGPEFGPARARVLSGGEAQRVAVARALLRAPGLVLADEPTASLDPSRGSEVMAALVGWQRAQPARRSLVWVTHNHTEAARFADLVIVLHMGGLPEGFERPRPNPGDPEVLKAWVDGDKGLPPNAETVARLRTEAADALGRQRLPGQYAGDENRTSETKLGRAFSRALVTGKLAAAEILSSPQVDSDGLRRWLIRLTAFSGGAVPKANWPGFLEEALGWRLLGLALTGGLAGLAATGWLAPWLGLVAGQVSILGAATAVLWPLLRRAEGLGQIAVYTILILSIAALEQGRRLLDASFEARLASPELSHVIISGSYVGDKLTPDRLADIGCQMEGLRLAARRGPEDELECRVRRTLSSGAPFPPNNGIFGRWERRAIAVARRTTEKSLDPIVACASPSGLHSPVGLVADPAEPVFGTIPGYSIDRDGKRKQVGPLDLRGDPADEVPVLAASQGFVVNALDFRASAAPDPYICVKFRDWQVVRIAYVLERLPSHGDTEFQLLIPPPLHIATLAPDLRDRLTAEYAAAAIYIPPKKVEAALEFVSGLAGQADRPKDGLSAEAGFKKIKSAVDAWTFSRSVAWAAILAAVGLSALLIVLTVANNIVENDKALCVMRAFGMRLRDVFLFLWLQTAVFFAVSSAVAFSVVYLAWPLIATAAAGKLGLTGAMFGRDAVLFFGGVSFAVAMTISCAVATLFWWWKSRFIARRLQRLA